MNSEVFKKARDENSNVVIIPIRSVYFHVKIPGQATLIFTTIAEFIISPCWGNTVLLSKRFASAVTFNSGRIRRIDGENTGSLVR